MLIRNCLPRTFAKNLQLIQQSLLTFYNRIKTNILSEHTMVYDDQGHTVLFCKPPPLLDITLYRSLEGRTASETCFSFCSASLLPSAHLEEKFELNFHNFLCVYMELNHIAKPLCVLIDSISLWLCSSGEWTHGLGGLVDSEPPGEHPTGLIRCKR